MSDLSRVVNAPAFLSGSYPVVVPFTLREAPTLLHTIETMGEWIVNVLVPFVNENIEDLSGKWDSEITRIIGEWGRLSSELKGSVDQPKADAIAAAALAEAAAAAAEIYASQAKEYQDPAIKGILSSLDSASRVYLDTVYPTKSSVEALDGEVSEVRSKVTALDAAIAAVDGKFAGFVSRTELDMLASEAVKSNKLLTAEIVKLAQTTHDEFNFVQAQSNYGIRVGGAGTTRVMQSIAVSTKPTNYILTSYATTGSVGGRESTTVVIHSAAGRAMGEMRFTDAGHGTGVFLETTDSGAMFIWLSAINHAVSMGKGRYNYVRVPWSAGTVHTWASMSKYVVSALSRDGYLTAHYDEVNGIVGVREDNDNGTGATFTVHSMASLVSGRWEPFKTMSYTYPNLFVQGWSYLDGYWYIYSGNAESESTYYPIEIVQVNADTGKMTARRSFEEIRNSYSGGPLYGSSEPEGITVGRSSNGNPSLVVGVSSALQGGRSHTLWYIGMGDNPFRSAGQAYDAHVGGTDWTSYPFTPEPDFTISTQENIAFNLRRDGEYLEIRGVINGQFKSGTTKVGTLLPGFYHPTRQLRGLALKSSVGASPSIAARVDINPSGAVSITVDPTPTHTGYAGWIDFGGFRVYIGN